MFSVIICWRTAKASRLQGSAAIPLRRAMSRLRCLLFCDVMGGLSCFRREHPSSCLSTRLLFITTETRSISSKGNHAQKQGRFYNQESLYKQAVQHCRPVYVCGCKTSSFLGLLKYWGRPSSTATVMTELLSWLRDWFLFSTLGAVVVRSVHRFQAVFYT